MSQAVRDLIRKMRLANPLWGAPRIHGESLKLGIEVSQATVAKYMARPRKPPSQTWRTFLNNHVKDLVSTDFFVVPTLSFRVLFVFVVLAHHRRRVLHFNVTANPTAEWTTQQMAEAFPWDSAPRYLRMIEIRSMQTPCVSECEGWECGNPARPRDRLGLGAKEVPRPHRCVQ